MYVVVAAVANGPSLRFVLVVGGVLALFIDRAAKVARAARGVAFVGVVVAVPVVPRVAGAIVVPSVVGVLSVTACVADMIVRVAIIAAGVLGMIVDMCAPCC